MNPALSEGVPTKIFLVACEPSGDSHASRLVSELRKSDPRIDCRGLGGPKMREAGVSLLEDMTRLSALGLGDVIHRYFEYRGIFYRALREVERFKPDCLLLIDSPAFNLRFAKKIRGRFPVLYYIGPQLWAWGGRRIHTIRKTVSKMLVILPFETEIYQKAGIPCEFVGHPLVESVRASADRPALRSRLGARPDEKVIGLLPGSRESEVRRMLPLMLETAAEIRTRMAEAVFWLIPSGNVRGEIYEAELGKHPLLDVRSLPDHPHDSLGAMDFALIASGTATTEAALLGTPFFLFYKTSWSTYLLGRQLIRVPYLGLVNILAGRRIVPEFIQDDIRPGILAREAEALLKNADLYEKMRRDFRGLKEKLGAPGASARAASAVLEFIHRRKGVVACRLPEPAPVRD